MNKIIYISHEGNNIFYESLKKTNVIAILVDKNLNYYPTYILPNGKEVIIYCITHWSTASIIFKEYSPSNIYIKRGAPLTAERLPELIKRYINE